MNNIFRMLTFITLTFSANSAMANDNPIVDFSALTGDYVASNSGLEIAIPSWTRVDNDSDGKIDGYHFRFNIYKLGTKTKLFSTPVKYLPYDLTVICTNHDPNIVKLIDFKHIGKTIVLSATFDGWCSTGNGRFKTGHIYVVDISAAGKTPQVKSFSGRLIGTSILPDKNGNGTVDLFVIIGTGYNSPVDYYDKYYTIYVYDGETGASLATPQKYAVEP